MESNERSKLSTNQKALQINLDHMFYGTFAEIGAGQEVARWFFKVGAAAGTISKSISAEWPSFIEPYLNERETLALCVCLVDTNIPPQESDTLLLTDRKSVV